MVLSGAQHRGIRLIRLEVTATTPVSPIPDISFAHLLRPKTGRGPIRLRLPP